MPCSWRPTAARLLVLASCAWAAAAGAQPDAAGQARLKGRIGDTPLEMFGRCQLARKAEPFTFWSDGADAPALGDANRDGLYLVVAVTREAASADMVATVVFRRQGQVVFDGVHLPTFTLSGNALSVDTLVTPDGAAGPILLRLAIVCDGG